MTLLLLSCGRPKLLKKTIESLNEQIPLLSFDERFLIDCKNKIRHEKFTTLLACDEIKRERNIMCNIDRLYQHANSPYVLFTEDDWEFLPTSVPLIQNISYIKHILDTETSASVLQLTGLDYPIHHNHTRHPMLNESKFWVWTRSPSGPNGNYCSWTNNPHFSKKTMRPPNLSREGLSSVALRKRGLTCIQTIEKYVKHIGGGYHVNESYLVEE